MIPVINVHLMIANIRLNPAPLKEDVHPRMLISGKEAGGVSPYVR